MSVADFGIYCIFMVLHGAIIHTTYRFVEKPEVSRPSQVCDCSSDPGIDVVLYSVHHVKNADTKLVKTIREGVMYLRARQRIGVGETYSLMAGIYHEVVPVGFTITWFVKYPKSKGVGVYVAVPEGEEPDNSYQRLEFDNAVIVNEKLKKTP